MNNIPLGAEFDPKAPWNDRDSQICPECGTEMEHWDYGSFRGYKWEDYKCPECGYTTNNEPDYD